MHDKKIKNIIADKHIENKKVTTLVAGETAYAIVAFKNKGKFFVANI